MIFCASLVFSQIGQARTSRYPIGAACSDPAFAKSPGV